MNVTQSQIVEIKDRALARGDIKTYHLAWVALGYWRHPAFLPATRDEVAEAIAILEAM